MTKELNQARIERQRTNYLNDLYDKALGGDIEAGEELSKIALGGFQPAKDLVEQMDARFAGTTQD